MSKGTHQIKAEQAAKKANGTVPLHRANVSKSVRKSVKPENIPAKDAAADDNAIQLRAYQIYQKKGGSDLDNWLEAEQTLKNADQDVARFINEGDPNIQ